MRIKAIREITPEPARCIEVSSSDRLFAVGGISGASIITHNSVVQRNIIIGCILRPDSWRFLGIDLKRVELSSYRAYSNVVLGIATELEDALTVLRFAQQTMMKRYTEMEQLGFNNFLDLPEKGQALMVMVDEAGELLSPSGVKSEEGKHDDELKGEASMIIGSIARLGRAAGVHLIIATQRPDAKLIPGETKANLGVRINCGRTNPTASSMILDSGEGSRVKGSPKGRLYVQIHGVGDHGQGFFADPNWLDEYLAAQGKNPDGSPLSQAKSKLASLTNFDELAEGDLDSRSGIDNEAAIEKIRQEEARASSGESSDDWGFDEAPENTSEAAPGWGEDLDNMFDELESDSEEQPLTEELRPAPTDDKLGKPEFGLGQKRDYSRPEDDWDSELDDLINNNFD